MFTWVCSYRDYARQRDHILAPITLEGCPSDDFLQAFKPLEAPRRKDVKTDDELDAARVPLHIGPQSRGLMWALLGLLRHHLRHCMSQCQPHLRHILRRQFVGVRQELVAAVDLLSKC